jgi:anti-anti-sigma factor
MTMEVTTAITLKRRGSAGTLTLSGVVDIFEAERLHAHAQRAIKDAKVQTLHLDLAQTERLDASAVQVLCALKHSLEASGRTLVLDAASHRMADFLGKLGVAL